MKFGIYLSNRGIPLDRLRMNDSPNDASICSAEVREWIRDLQNKIANGMDTSIEERSIRRNLGAILKQRLCWYDLLALNAEVMDRLIPNGEDSEMTENDLNEIFHFMREYVAEDERRKAIFSHIPSEILTHEQRRFHRDDIPIERHWWQSNYPLVNLFREAVVAVLAMVIRFLFHWWEHIKAIGRRISMQRENWLRNGLSQNVCSLSGSLETLVTGAGVIVDSVSACVCHTCESVGSWILRRFFGSD
jgi:hypothetical protein